MDEVDHVGSVCDCRLCVKELAGERLEGGYEALAGGVWRGEDEGGGWRWGQPVYQVALRATWVLRLGAL